MIGPSATPHAFGFAPGDSHLIVNDINEKAAAFNSSGRKLWEVPCLARGQGADTSYQGVGEDTPPGLYRIGRVYRDYEAWNPDTPPPRGREVIPYGWYSFDLVELENQERKYGRAGIMIHGGGSACGYPGYWAPDQLLYPTFGCVRMHNIHLRELLLPLVDKGTVFVSVYQEG